jgi:hypothetical protein
VARSSTLPRVVLRELTPSEAAFQARVVTLARSLGYLCFHAHDSRHGEAGYPDLSLLRERDGRRLWAELKVGTRPLRPAQARFVAAARRNPLNEIYVWRWVWPGDVLEEIAAVLAR